MKVQCDGRINKTGWGVGPWTDEPDRAEWRDRQTGYPCLAVRNESAGMWCGYVAVPPGHRAHGRHHSDVDDDVGVHGGLTYSGPCDERGKVCHVARDGEPDDVWWLGFDCNHSGDYAPGQAALLRKICAGDLYMDQDDAPRAYRTFDHVRDECASLAAQLLALGGVA